MLVRVFVLAFVSLLASCSNGAATRPDLDVLAFLESAPSQRHSIVLLDGDELDWFRDAVRHGHEGVRQHVCGARGARPFVRLLATFNADVPLGCGASLEVRVRERTSGRWSPWMRLLTWGEAPLDDTRTVAHDRVRVDVDELICEDEQDAYDCRVLTNGPQPVSVECISIVLSAAAPLAPSTAARVTPQRRWPAPLDVPRRSQRVEDPALAPRICSPTSVAMVMDHHGVSRPTNVVAQRLFDAEHDLYGNWARAVQGAYSLGVPGVLARFDDWEAVAGLIERGCPLVVSIGVREGELTGAPYTSTSGHLVVLCGFEPSGDVVVNDPADPDVASSRRVYRRDQFERVWMVRGGTAYVLLAPGEAH